MNRRHLLQALSLPLITQPLIGCTFMDNKKSISQYGKVFEYLKDPDLRVKEMGEQVMEVKGALVSGVPFREVAWRNIRFVECDFTGSYEMKLARLENCLFTGCRFAGLFGFGLAKDVYFNRCVVRGNADSALYTDKGSTNVVFENGDFQSLAADRETWASLVMDGEAKYINCYVKWFHLSGGEKLDIERCRIEQSVIARSGIEVRPPVTIIDTELLGTTDMVSSHMSSLTMRNCTVGVLDLKQAHVSGDVLIEKVAGERIDLSVKSARNVTVRNCTLHATEDQKFSFEIASDSTDQLVIQNCKFGDVPVAIGPGGWLPEEVLQAPPRNTLTRVMACTLSSLDAAYALSKAISIEGCTISSADFSNSRIGHLQIEGSTISQKLDLRNTRIQTHSIKDLEPSKYRQVLLDGSSIKQLSI